MELAKRTLAWVAYPHLLEVDHLPMSAGREQAEEMDTLE